VSYEIEPPSTGKAPIKVELARVLGLSDAVFIGIGSLIGGGIFTLTGLALGYAGPSLILVIVLNGIIALMTAFVYAELGAILPEAGGAFIWVKRGLGDLAGHVTGWISWFANAVACGLYSISFGFYVGTILFLIILPVFGIYIPFGEGSFFQKLVAVITILFVGYINFKGVSGTSRFGKKIVYSEILILAIFGIFGLISFFKKPDFAGSFLPILPNGITGLLAAMGLMYIGFEGSEIIVQSGEEIKNPKKNLPRAIFIALGIVVFLYLVTIFSVLGGAGIKDGGDWQVMAQAGQGVLIKAGSFFMPGLEWIMIFGGLLAALAALNATVFSSSHVSFSMGRAGFLPKIFAKVHSQNKTPYLAIFISTFLILIIVAFLPLKDVAAIVNLLFIFLFLQLHIALIALRKKLPDIKRPFKVPFYPAPSIIAILAYLVLTFQLFHVSPTGIVIVLFWVLSGLLIYYVYAKPKVFEKVEKQVIFEEKIRMAKKKKYQILVPLSLDNWQNILKLAVILAKEKDAEISVLRIKLIPRPLPLRVSSDELEREKILLDEVSAFCRDFQVNVDVKLVVARSISGAVLEITKKEDPDLLILGWKGWVKTRGKIFGRDLDRVLRETKCDLIVARINCLNDFKSIFLPSAGGPHIKFAGRVARALAAKFNSKINVAYVASGKGVLNPKERLSEVVSSLEMEDWPHLKTEVLFAKSSSPRSIACQIVQRSQDFDCILMTSGREKFFREMIFDSTPEIVARNSTCSLILVKHHRDIIEPLVSYLKSRF